MIQKIFRLDSSEEYSERLRGLLLENGEAELIFNPDLNSGSEVYYIGSLRTTLVYGGGNTLTIAGHNEMDVRHTEGFLSKIRSKKLEEIS